MLTLLLFTKPMLGLHTMNAKKTTIPIRASEMTRSVKMKPGSVVQKQVGHEALAAGAR